MRIASEATLVFVMLTLPGCRFGYEEFNPGLTADADEAAATSGGSENGSGGGQVLSDGSGGMGGSDAGGSDASGGSDGVGGSPPPVTPVEWQAAPQTTTSVGNELGGNPHTDLCGQDQILVGLSGALAVEGWHGMLRAHCAEWEIVGSDSYFVELVSINLGPVRGEIWDVNQDWERLCPDGEGIVGIQASGGAFIDALTLTCAPLVPFTSGGTLALGLGVPHDLTMIGGTGGTPFEPLECPAGTLGVGLNLRSGFYIDMLQLVCDGFVALP